MPAVGSMRDRYTFQRRIAGSVVGGIDRAGGWGDDYTCAVEVTYLRGTEAVQAARLQGDQPVVLTVYACRAARLIDNTWRAVDARDPTRVFEITSAARNKDIAFIDVLAVQRRGDFDG